MECEETIDARPLRQGDLFLWLQGRAPTTALGFGGILVTADCDFAQAKHAGVLSYVPLLDLEDYARLFILPKLLKRPLDQVRDELVKLVHDAQASAGPGRMSKEIALQWLRATPEHQVAEDLTLDQKTQDSFARLRTLLIRAEAALATGTFTDLATAFIDLRTRSGKTKAEAAWTDFRSAMDGSPGDAFFLSEPLPSRKAGCFAYLRLIREIEPYQIAIRQPDLSSESTMAIRVRRLASPFRYRLTQQMAEVFTAIGLPDTYDARRKDLIGALSPPNSK